MQALGRLSFLLLLLFFTSCVGTVKDTAEEIQRSVETNPYEIRFDGVLDAKVTAHNKVRLYFKPAQGGSGIFSYNAYVDGNYTSARASTSYTEPDHDGNLYIDVKGLDTGKLHSFLVRAYDIQNTAEDKNNVIVNISTLPYEVPVFEGANTLENVPGIIGETSLRVTWVQATAASEGSGFGQNPRAISGYNIYVGTTVENMTLYGSTSDATATSFVITGLDPSTKYFTKVLARDSQSPVNLEDANYTILSNSTKSGEPISFVGLESASIPKGTQGFSTINLSWSPGSGGFDRYKIFVRTDATTPDPTTDTPHTSDITDLTLTSTQITVSNPYTLYYVTVVACDTTLCEEFEGEKVSLPVTTTPPIAPFNGINNLAQAPGQYGLTQLEASWVAPDTSNGVYDEVKIFFMSSGGTVIGEIDRCGGAGTDPCYEVISPNKVKVINLNEGQEYCMMSKAYSTTPYKSDEPNGRTHSNEIVKCATPTYKEPSFLGPNNECSGITATDLTVKWDLPAQAGTYEKFEIYYTGSADTFDFTEAISGDSDYTRVSLAPETTSWELTDLNPGTTYKIGIKTFLEDLQNPGTGFRDSNIKIITCETNEAKASHKGWFNVLSLGAKVDGRDGQIVPERYRPIDLTANPKIYNPYPQEHRTGDPTAIWPDPQAVSSSGMVVLKWDDFEIEGIGKMIDIIDRHPDNGYNIYRKEYETGHATFAPQIDDISNTALSSWTKVNDTVIKSKVYEVQSNIDRLVKYERPMGVFVDYSVENTDEEKTKNYWYLVVATLAGKNLDWSEVPSDGRLEVVLPPKNLTLVHRWMANQTMCDTLRRPVDRANHYRCEYNGLGSTFDPITNDHFYDTQNHILVSRFGLGANFTRGTCKDVGYSTYFRSPEYNSSNIGVFDGVSTPGGTGDCIGSRGRPDGQVQAYTGDVFYDRVQGITYINDTLDNFSNPQFGSDWDIVYYFGENDNKIKTQGLGKKIGTMSAHMPRLRVRHEQASQICDAYSVDHKEVEHKLRLVRKKEYMAAFDYSPFLDDNQVKSLENGNLQGASENQIECSKSYRRGYLTNPDLGPQDYSANGTDHYTFIGGKNLDGSYVFDENIDYHENSQDIATGSSGPNSTEMCISKFGIQDFTSDQMLLSDTFWVNSSGSLDAKYERDPVDPTTTLPRTDKYISYDSGFMEDYKNGNGYYFNTIAGSEAQFYSGDTTYRWAKDDGLFYNPVMGLFLTCDGISCIKDGQPDDNQLISHLSSGTTASILGYRIAGYSPGDYFEDVTGYDVAFTKSKNNWRYTGYDNAFSFWYSRTDTSEVVKCSTQVPAFED